MIKINDNLMRRAIRRETSEEGMREVLNIGQRYAGNFTIDSTNEGVYGAMLEWCLGRGPADIHKGFYIYGGVGTGKSLLTKVFRDLCRTYGIGVMFGNKECRLAWDTYLASEICDYYSGDGLLRRWTDEKRCLCIQDLGAEPQESVCFGNRVRVMRSVLEARGDLGEGCITIITSNLKPDMLRAVYGDRVASRVWQMCNVYKLGGEDRRKISKPENNV